ncbi:MAG: cytochrome c3 family protein [Nitrospirota bacterium]
MKFIREISYKVMLLFLTVFFMGISVSYADAKDTCVECHKDVKFKTQNRVLFDYYSNWINSTHEIEKVKCIDCHGGDPAKSDKESAHKDDFSSLTAADRFSFKKIPERCGKCHEAILKNFTKSKHYKALLEKGTGPHCSTCHGSMNADVYFTSVISRSCKNCHNEYSKNLPEVVGEADKILHRINVAHVYKKWVLIEFHFTEPAKVDEVLVLYNNVAESWHKFDFKELDQKSQDLLKKIKLLVSRGPLAKK